MQIISNIKNFFNDLFKTEIQIKTEICDLEETIKYIEEIKSIKLNKKILENDIYKFINFKKTSIREFLNQHRDCRIEQVIGTGVKGDGFRFIKCINCKLAYYTGKV